MRTGGMLCRSQAATAVCVPGDARSMVVGRRADRTIAEDARTLHDVRYVRLGGDGAGAARVSSRQVAPPQPPPMPRRRGAPVAVTLPMVTKSPVETPARDTAAAKRTSATPTAAVAPGEQVLQVRSPDQLTVMSRALAPGPGMHLLGGRDEGGYTLPGVCRESEEAHLQNGSVEGGGVPWTIYVRVVKWSPSECDTTNSFPTRFGSWSPGLRDWALPSSNISM
uniref:Uncharacterized protein n=1 Tax=Aegilops tauschii subsp. strangulata TaxID=200361 RepID=A0A452Z9A5_AEGTS